MNSFDCQVWAHVLGGLHTFSGFATIIFGVTLVLSIFDFLNIPGKQQFWGFIIFLFFLMLKFIIPTTEIVQGWCG